MAGENKETGPDLGVRGIDPKDLSSTIKEAKRIQGDYNDEIKDSLRQLNAIAKSYESIKSKLESLSKETLNIKELEKQKSKAIEKQTFEANKLKDLQKKAGEDGGKNARKLFDLEKLIKQQETEARRSKEIGDSKAQKAALKALKSTEDQRKKLLENIKPTELALAAQMKSKDIADQQLETVQEYLETEKDVAKQMGFTGKAVQFISKNLGIGKNLYSKIVVEAREGESKTKLLVVAGAALAGVITVAWKAFKGFVNIADQGLRSLTGSGGPVSNFVSPFTNLIKQIPVIGGLLGGIIDAFANVVDFATGANSEVQKFARNLGISYDEAKLITDQFDQLARTSGQAFITVEKLRKSQTELSEALGINNILSGEILAADAQIAEQAGLDLEIRKQLAIVAGVTNTTQTKIFATIAAQNKLLSAGLGVNLRVQDVIKRASSFAGVLGLTFAKYPEKLTKSLLITRALGMDLQKLDGLASGLLDFESSIAKEFEAQLLSGKNINMMRARELALNNDLAGLAVEINKQLGTSEDFLKSNRLIQESLADATGMTRDEIADMLKQQELFAKAGATDLKTFKERIVQMERAGTLQEDFISKLSEEQAQLFLNSTATERIASFFDKIRQSFANLLNNEAFKGFIDTIITKLSDPNFINGIISKLTNFVSLLLKAVAAIVDAADVAANVLSLGTVDISNRIPGQIKAIANQIGGVSLTGNVLRTQTAGTGTGQTTTVAGGGFGSPTINVIANTTVEDHAKTAHVRYSMAPRMDQKTGQMQQ